MLNRRDLLGLAVATGTASAALPAIASAADEPATPTLRIIDTNVSLFQWPFRRLPLDNIDALVNKLHRLGTTSAWAGTFEGLLHRDVAAVNQRLADTCQHQPSLVPIGSVNPSLPNWEDDLHRCAEKHNMHGIRLHPNYHGYGLNDERFIRLLKLATARRLFVQIAVSMEDTRTQHSSVRVPDVDVAPLPEIMSRFPTARVQLINHKLRTPVLAQLGKTPGLFFDTARVGATDGIPNLVKSVPAGRVFFGSHAPFLIPEAALIRTHESGILNEPELRALLAENAQQALERTSA